MSKGSKPRIVVLGAGFGGLTFCQKFHHPAAKVTLVDRTNHHLFQPLLYQVATAGLSAPEIAQPIRAILANKPNVSVIMDEVKAFDLAARCVMLERQTLEYDYLVLALGGRTGYFGHPEWAGFAPGLKSLDDALRIRRDVLLAFERAETEPDPQTVIRLMTIVVVGGGPTGVELAGALAELARVVLRRDFRRIDPTQARVVLIEASTEVLSHMTPDLAASATKQLRVLGVQVRTSTRVKSITKGRIELESGELIEAENILWAAGVAANALTPQLGVDLDRAGRVKVAPDLSLPGHPEVFAIGDMVSLLQKDGKPVPGVSPAAMQEASFVARVMELDLATESSPRAPRPAFQYVDKGTMATIGRSAAVAQIGSLKLSGFVAWVAWLVVHLLFLIGFRNKAAVLLQWIISYFTYSRGSRIIVQAAPPPKAGSCPESA